MPLVLSLPGLLARDAYPPAPSLARLIAYADAPRSERDGAAAALAPLYGVHRQTDWPLAPIRVASFGVDPGSAYWLAADPVTLVAGRDDVRLAGVVRDLSDDDARALVDALNAHFAPDGVAFVAPAPHAWFARTAVAPAIATHPLEVSLGGTLRTRMPDGPDARTWRRRQNEIQMLLFEHPVNLARERNGKPPANSVWLEHGGTMPARETTAVVRTWSGDATLRALAAFAGAPARPLPGSLDAVLRDASRGDTLVVAFDPPVDVQAVDRGFARPALRALERGAIDAVTLVATGAGAALAWHARRPSPWTRLARRWRDEDLAALVNAAAAGDNR